MKRINLLIMMCLLACVGAWAQEFTIKGTVADQDGKPIVGAQVSFNGAGFSGQARTDADGRYQIGLEDKDGIYIISAHADGYTSITEGPEIKPSENSVCDLVLYNALNYQAGKRYTIILPVTPDALAGRYFRLDRVEGGNIIFERESSPQANIPYVFYPNKDFRIDLRDMDLSMEAGQTIISVTNEKVGSREAAYFIGSYSYINYSDILERDTPVYFDDDNNGYNYGRHAYHIDAMHATLLWNWHAFDSPFQPTYEAPSFVFHDPEEDIPTYHPFVERGKKWCVHGFSMGGDHTVTDYYFSEEEILFERNGHFYEQLRTRTQDGKDELVGWFREENQRVYIYNETEDKEVLTYDFSLEEGDRFSPEYGDYSQCEVKNVSYKEINGERLKVITFEANDRNTDARTEVEWIEGIGSLSWPLAGLYSGNPNSWSYNTAYVLYDNPFEGNYYLPLTFVTHYAGWWGQQPQIDRQPTLEGDSQFQYELVPDPEHDCYTLHVYGDTVWSNSPNRYAYCVADKSSSTFKVSIKYEELEPYVDGIGRYHVDINFPFFLSELPNVAVDQFGEHPIVVRQDIPTDYRPFIEEGKVWKVGTFGTYSPEIGGYTDAHSIEYFYFDGDTIVGGQRCKKMMCREECDINWHWYHEPQTSYVGAIYENNQRVYCALLNRTDFLLLYDFASAPETEIEYYNTLEKESTKGLIARRMVCEDGLYHGKVTEINLFNKTYIDRPETNIYWREGVGYNGFYNSWYTSLIGSRKNLMQCTLGDEILYNDPSLKDCVTPQDSEVKKNWLDFTHTVKTRPKGPRRVEAESDEETVTGEYSVKELFVNFKTLTGPYTIKVTGAAGDVIYNKVVQTSNVVALNTDISTYPKGSYTITIENENEVYSAEFNIKDEDGLSPTPSPVKQGSIYNLKGQRLTQPQRGVNIINGRKVVVK